MRMGGCFEMRSPGYFVMRKGGKMVVRIGGKVDANIHQETKILANWMLMTAKYLLRERNHGLKVRKGIWIVGYQL